MRLKWLSWLFVVVLVLGACAPSSGGDADERADRADETAASVIDGEHRSDQVDDSEQTDYPLTVTDDSGVEVTLSEEPQSIISILPSSTEIAFALGLDEQIIAVTDNDDYPEQVKDKDTVGGMELNIEKIVSLRPDLVLAGQLNGEAVQKLRDLGVTVLVAEGEDLASTYDSITLIGQVTNRVAEAEDIVRSMQKDVDEVKQQVGDLPREERTTVWLEVDPTMFTAGAGTMMDELIQLAGGNNIAAEELEGWGQLSEENIVALNPDVIIGTYGEESLQQAVADRRAWSELKAVQQGRIYAVDESAISRPGPRLTEALQHLAALFYPEMFEQEAP